MTWAEYIDVAVKYCGAYPKQRTGQGFFNALTYVRPELAERVRGVVGLDPFYKDENLHNFLTFIGREW